MLDTNLFITVLMPVYNSEDFVNDAIKSVLNQSFTNFELLIYDDCSTDNSLTIIHSFIDPRIKVFTKEKNNGYTDSLIQGVKRARGKYIARMDSDDFCYPERFETQLRILESNPNIGIIGSAIDVLKNESVIDKWIYPANDDDIKMHLLINSPFAHPSVMIRRSILIENNLNYDLSYEPCEDYKLWTEILKHSEGRNVSKPLMQYRLHPKQTINLKKDALIQKSNKVRGEILFSIFNKNFSNPEIETHYSFFNDWNSINDLDKLYQKQNWRKKLKTLFKNSQFQELGIDLVEKYWFLSLKRLTKFNPKIIHYFISSSKSFHFDSFDKLKFIFKCLTFYKVKLK